MQKSPADFLKLVKHKIKKLFFNSTKKKVDFTPKPVILGTMNYAQEQLEYLEWKAQAEQEKRYHPCDISEGVYALVDDDSPSESPMFFLTLEGASTYAEGSYPYCNGNWSVYRIGQRVM